MKVYLVNVQGIWDIEEEEVLIHSGVDMGEGEMVVMRVDTKEIQKQMNKYRDDHEDLLTELEALKRFTDQDFYDRYTFPDYESAKTALDMMLKRFADDSDTEASPLELEFLEAHMIQFTSELKL